MATDRLEKRMNEAKKKNNKINQVTTYWKVLSNPQMQNFVIKKNMSGTGSDVMMMMVRWYK